VNNVIIKNAILLSIIYNISYLCDTEVVKCILLAPIERVDGLIHYLHIR
jgi:hypothetical protein